MRSLSGPAFGELQLELNRWCSEMKGSCLLSLHMDEYSLCKIITCAVGQDTMLVPPLSLSWSLKCAALNVPFCAVLTT